MPNTPASVGEGMAAIAPGKKASPEFVKEAEDIFSALGKEAVVTERQLDELYRADAMDIDSDIRVMETMLRRDSATVADDFGLGGSTAVQQEEE